MLINVDGIVELVDVEFILILIIFFINSNQITKFIYKIILRICMRNNMNKKRRTNNIE